MKIPKSFKIYAQTIKVVYDAKRFSESDRGSQATASYRTNEIILDPQEYIPQDAVTANFFHEFAHFLLYHAGNSYSGKEEYLHRDEKLVDTLGNLLHQSLTTFEE